MRRIGTEERCARLAVRHHVAPTERVATMVEAARDMVCLHATDPATVFLSAWARLLEPSISAMEQTLYEDRRLFRMLAMRRTMFVTPVEDAPLLHASASLGVARTERKRNETMLEQMGVGDVRRWMGDAEAEVLEALEGRGEATTQELAADVPRLRERLRVNVGKKYESDISMASRTLLLMAVEGKIARTRPRGTWISSQYRWARMERWLGQPMPEVPVDEAQTEMVRRWLARFGPGTEGDIRWWTGWTAREVRAALARLDPVEVDLDGATGLVLPGDLETTPAPPPWVALLPPLDPTTMGWQTREWYLGPHKTPLFDTSGNAGPTIWVDGRIVGGWAIRPTGEVVIRLLEDVGAETARAVDAEAARLTDWLEALPVVPRFPTPLYRELVG